MKVFIYEQKTTNLTNKHQNNMQFSLEGKSILTLDYKEGENKSTFVSTDFFLKVSGCDEKNFINEEGIPNKEGSKALSQCFISGLISNLHYGRERGYWDDAEHLRFIISELERMFIEVPNDTVIRKEE